MAVELSDVDKSIVMAGGVTTANFPQVAMNLRRSSLAPGSSADPPDSTPDIETSFFKITGSKEQSFRFVPGGRT
jgi:hypothetical protein